MLKIRKNIELFRKVFRQIMGINEFIERRTAIFFYPFCWTVIHNMIQQKIDTNQDKNKKYLFQRISLFLFILLPIFLAFPSKSRAEDSETLRTSTTTHNIILCRTGRLTDIVVPEKILKVAMSNPSDFKILIIRYKSRTHMVLKPLKEAAKSDLIIFGVNHVHYLLAKTVLKGQLYAIRVEIGAQILDSPR